MILLGFLCVLLLISILVNLNNKDSYEKLYEVYSKDPNFTCKANVKCIGKINVTINGKEATLTKEININEIKDYQDASYFVTIETDTQLYYGSFNLEEEEKAYSEQVKPVSITFRYNKNDIHYSGIYYVEDDTITLNTVEDVDIQTYLSAKNEATLLSTYVTNITFEDLQKYDK